MELLKGIRVFMIGFCSGSSVVFHPLTLIERGSELEKLNVKGCWLRKGPPLGCDCTWPEQKAEVGGGVWGDTWW